MSLYLNNGYVDIEYCLKFGCPFTFILGGRGTGKTFGALLFSLQRDRKLIFMRRTQAQLDIINRPEFNPFNPVCEFIGTTVQFKAVTKYNSSIQIGEGESAKIIGFTAALSTFANLRGFDASAIDFILMDEFIPENHERPIKNEGSAFLNCYETCNRNRELQGKPPMQALLLTNSNSLDSPLLLEMDLIRVIEKMRKRGQTEYINTERGIAIFDLIESPISTEKAETALYKATRGTKFQQMAIGNEFAYSDTTDCKSMPLTGMRLLWRYGNIYGYQAQNFIYISEHGSGTPGQEYEDTKIDTQRFVREHKRLYRAIINRKIRYENYNCKHILTELFI